MQSEGLEGLIMQPVQIDGMTGTTGHQQQYDVQEAAVCHPDTPPRKRVARAVTSGLGRATRFVCDLT